MPTSGRTPPWCSASWSPTGSTTAAPTRSHGLEVSWQLEGDALRLSVFDGGGTSVPHVVAPDPYAPRGRGLAIVQALTTAWWFDGTGGTRVTAVLAVG